MEEAESFGEIHFHVLYTPTEVTHTLHRHIPRHIAHTLSHAHTHKSHTYTCAHPYTHVHACVHAHTQHDVMHKGYLLPKNL